MSLPSSYFSQLSAYCEACQLVQDRFPKGNLAGEIIRQSVYSYPQLVQGTTTRKDMEFIRTCFKDSAFHAVLYHPPSETLARDYTAGSIEEKPMNEVMDRYMQTKALMESGDSISQDGASFSGG